MIEQQIDNAELIELVRKAVIKNGGKVTVGDIVSTTGLNRDDAKTGLDALIKTHEGTLQVSDKGEILYAFAPGVTLRDQRSWWERNKKTIYKGVKAIFKVIIFLVLVIYFIIYLVLLIALLSSGRNNNNSNSGNLIGWGFYFFWGWGSGGDYTERKKRQPVYTSVYNFVFGPEEAELDPLEGQRQCAQLIRAKNGIITVEDWMMISGQSREKCESDLARYTAEFGGDAQILNDGTLIYVFEEMMRSTQQNALRQMPSPAWEKLQRPRPLSGNIDGGNGIVIGLNIFNLIMAGFCSWALAAPNLIEYAQDSLNMDYESAVAYANELGSYTFWLGFFPFLFSFLIFAVPLIRLPGNIKENRRRRKNAIRSSLISTIFDKHGNPTFKVSDKVAYNQLNSMFRSADLEEPSVDEYQEAMNEILTEFKGEIDLDSITKTYSFKDITDSAQMAEKERQSHDFKHQSVGDIVYSTDSEEQDKIDGQQFDKELSDFDRKNKASGGFGGYSGYGQQSDNGKDQYSQSDR